jgi:hypothetical protein
MKHLITGCIVLLVGACAHEPAPPAHATAGNATSQAAPGNAAPTVAPPAVVHPVATTPVGRTAKAAFLQVKNADGSVTRLPLNMDLLKQGYHSGLRKGQVMYCRTEQLTGSRFKTEVCLSEAQILDEQQHARDTMTGPRRTRCIGPECNN